MLDLAQSLNLHDLGHLRNIAELWDFELEAPDVGIAIQNLVQKMLNPKQLEGMLRGLPEEARLALADLRSQEGASPWAHFTRRHGTLRQVGPGRRDREKFYLRPVNACEMLWYRGLIARQFIDTADGPQEFVIIPTDLLALIPPTPVPQLDLGRPATQKESEIHGLATDVILDHACTLLALLRMGLPTGTLDEIPSDLWQASTTSQPYPFTSTFLIQLLQAMGLLDSKARPLAEPTRQFLEAQRGQAMLMLTQAWLHSPEINDLRLLPGLVCEGEWQNDPLRARQALLSWLDKLPTGKWWSLPAFLNHIKETNPDYQRPAGDYDSWYIRAENTTNYFRGFENWDSVDGALLRYLISGPMHWLGMTDLAAPGKEQPAAAFRLSRWAASLIANQAASGLAAEDKPLLATSNLAIHFPRLAPRAVRYQVARFCQWESERNGEYHYRLTPASLQSALKQGLRTDHLIALINRHTRTVPPNLVKALQRWEVHGVEARIQSMTILRLRTPEILQILRKSKAARFLGEPLGPAVVAIKPGAEQKVLLIMAELGFLAEAQITE